MFTLHGQWRGKKLGRQDLEQHRIWGADEVAKAKASQEVGEPMDIVVRQIPQGPKSKRGGMMCRVAKLVSESASQALTIAELFEDDEIRGSPINSRLDISEDKARYTLLRHILHDASDRLDVACEKGHVVLSLTGTLLQSDVMQIAATSLAGSQVAVGNETPNVTLGKVRVALCREMKIHINRLKLMVGEKLCDENDDICSISALFGEQL